MEHWDEIGFSISRLSHAVFHMTNQVAFSSDSGGARHVTRVQGRIMGYLYENRERDIFQRDIQALLSVTRSTVTSNLQAMEQLGLITRTSVDWDARLKKIELTPKSLDMQERLMQGFDRSEKLISSLITPEEKREMLRLCKKIFSGLEKYEASAKAERR